MRRLAEPVAAFWALAGGVLILAIMAVTSINAGTFALDKVARLFDANVAGLSGYEDFVRLAVSCAALMFFPYCQARRGHIVVSLFVDMMSAASRSALDRIWLVATVMLALFLAYWMVVGMLETRDDGALSPILGWPEWPFYAPGIVSLILWAAIAALQAFEDVDADA